MLFQPISDNTMAVIRIIDDTTEYIAEAKPGSTSSDAVWRCRKITTVVAADTTYTQTWADGDTDFDNIADNLKSLTYV